MTHKPSNYMTSLMQYNFHKDVLCTCQSVILDVPDVYDRGPSDHRGDSDNGHSFRYHSNIILTLQMIEI